MKKTSAGAACWSQKQRKQQGRAKRSRCKRAPPHLHVRVEALQIVGSTDAFKLFEAGRRELAHVLIETKVGRVAQATFANVL